MEECEYYIPKSEWGQGEWQNEPDLYEFIYNGYNCFCIRIMFHGAWCGYLEIPKDNLDQIDYENIECHGGITWSESYLTNKEANEHFFYVGFDCSHGNDIQPAMNKYLIDTMPLDLFNRLYGEDSFFKREYRNLEYVIGELKGMIDQIEDMLKITIKDA